MLKHTQVDSSSIRYKAIDKMESQGHRDGLFSIQDCLPKINYVVESMKSMVNNFGGKYPKRVLLCTHFLPKLIYLATLFKMMLLSVDWHYTTSLLDS